MHIALSHDAWTTLGAAVTTLGGVAIAHLSTRRVVAKNGEAIEQVRRLSEPTGNGFAGRTIGSLERLEASMIRIEEAQTSTEQALVVHLGDHARAGMSEH